MSWATSYTGTLSCAAGNYTLDVPALGVSNVNSAGQGNFGVSPTLNTMNVGDSLTLNTTGCTYTSSLSKPYWNATFSGSQLVINATASSDMGMGGMFTFNIGLTSGPPPDYLRITFSGFIAGDPTPTLTFGTPTSASVAMQSTLTNAATSSVSGGGAITYTSSDTSKATVDSSGVVTGVAVGSTTITATQAAASGVNAQATQTYALTVTLAQQATLSIPGATSLTRVSAGYNLTTSGGSGSGAVTYTAGPAGTCSIVSGAVMAGSTIGQCTVTATKAASGIYDVATATKVINVVAEPAPTLTFATPAPSPITLFGALTNAVTSTAVGSVTYPVGAITYTSSNTAVATVNSASGQITPVAVGTTTITATQAAGSGANSAATQTYTLTVTLVPQATFTVSSSNTSLIQGGATATLSTSGGTGSGAITYAVTSGQSSCTLNGNTVTSTSTLGTCTITATKATDGTYAVATATVSIGVGNAPTPTLTFSTPTSLNVNMGSSATNAVTSTITGVGSGSISYTSSNTSVATVNSSNGQITPVAAGTATITATQVAGVGVNAQATQTYTLTVSLIPQATLIAASSSNTILPSSGTATLSTTGGSGAGNVTYAVTNGSCTISGTTLTAGASTGTCTVTATKAAASNYAAITATVTVNVANLLSQAAIAVLSSPVSVRVNATSTLSLSGGSGSGAVSYVVTNGSCTINGSTLTAPASAGSCTVTATKAADSTYASASAVTTISVNALSAQAALVVSASPSAISKNTGSSSLSTTGGSGIGAVTYAVTAGSCTISGNSLRAGAVSETCAVTATRAADANYMSITGTVNIAVNDRASIADAVDRSVIGTVTAQVTVAQRFADTQVNNIADHIQNLRSNFDVKSNRLAIGINSPELSQAAPVLQKLREAIIPQSNRTMSAAETVVPESSQNSIEELVQKLNDAINSGNLAQVLSLYAGSDRTKVKAALQGFKSGQGESKILSIKALGANEFLVSVERTLSTGNTTIPLAIQISRDGQYELRYSQADLVKSTVVLNTNSYGSSGEFVKVKSTNDTQLAQANNQSLINQTINQELFGDAPIGIWAVGNLDYGRIAVAGASNAFSTQGITFGLDLQVDKHLIVGAALGYGFDNTTIDTFGTNVKSNQFSFSAYSVYQPAKDWFVDAIMGYGNLNTKNNRYSSAASSIFSADRNGSTVYGSLGLGNIITLNKAKIEPYARAGYTSINLNAYTEGSNSVALAYDKSRLINGSLAAGLLVSEDFAVQGGTITPSAKLQVKRYAVGSLNQGVYYSDTPSESTVISMTPAPQNVQSFGLGVVYTVKKNGTWVGLNWLGSIGSSSYRANAVRADLRVPF